MKLVAIISVIIAVFAIFLPVFIFIDNPFDFGNNSAKTAENLIELPESGADFDTSVKVFTDKTVKEMNMRDYLIGVVAAEMPASFETEALKAQAVAARTYTLYKMLVAPSEKHPEANVCDDITCCKAYKSTEELKSTWGDSYETYLNRIMKAVYDTDGVYIDYEDEPVLAVFHSSSAGFTEASENVWGSALPYLKSVESPETGEEVPNYTYKTAVSFDDFKTTVKDNCPEAVFLDDRKTWIGETAKTDSGRIDTVLIGGSEVSGTSLRSMFSLRSAAVSIEVTDEGVIMTTTGYGHGVGMSQYGANALAKDGYGYEDIIKRYYTGVQLKNMAELAAKQ